MSTLVMGLALILLIAAVSVALGAAIRVVLGVLLPAPPPDDDPRWVRPADPSPRTPAEAFERGNAAITRTLAPDATVPIARLSREDEPPAPPEPDVSRDQDPVGRAIDRIAVRF
ncbi:hypothetical protein Bra3105_10725 [Brachybacterium halotolerans subsp. kimchii]|uniref:Uncharacterized protein n=1 Tax=Brachybacterium halotolerans TaxID=2795215 RepID=A0ABS1B9Y4_9MICO|nr:hypothetical protein [Brachybacterium halotolerans]MBK0331312.1 hypothetical protein [Brachybacterium halotolerans]UEJ81324.1 hypothetical protein Bra3105_10725 [Brachybacterium halotolerans subsp. kimchii]